jgi:hypothetical protein
LQGILARMDSGGLGQKPVGDGMLAQKIALETNERAALAVANRSPVTQIKRSIRHPYLSPFATTLSR